MLLSPRSRTVAVRSAYNSSEIVRLRLMAAPSGATGQSSIHKHELVAAVQHPQVAGPRRPRLLVRRNAGVGQLLLAPPQVFLPGLELVRRRRPGERQPVRQVDPLTGA